MENLIDHIAAVISLLAAAGSVWFARKTGKHTARSQRLKDIITKACDAGTANKQPGTPLAKTRSRRIAYSTQLRAEVDAELARRAR